MSLLEAHNLPFAAALLLMLMLALVQLLGIAEISLDGDSGVELEVDADAEIGWIDGLLSFFGIGRLPFTMWLALALFLFAGVGFGIQQLAQAFLGGPFDPLLASAGSAILSLPLAGTLSRPLARILPQDETTAVGLDALVGRRATILNGRAAANFPARAQVKDHFGHPHNVMVEPHDPAEQMVEGDQVLLVRRQGERFFCVALEERLLVPTS